MKTFITTLALAATIFCSCKTEDKRPQIEKDFDTYVQQDFADPSDFIEIVSYEKEETDVLGLYGSLIEACDSIFMEVFDMSGDKRLIARLNRRTLNMLIDWDFRGYLAASETAKEAYQAASTLGEINYYYLKVRQKEDGHKVVKDYEAYTLNGKEEYHFTHKSVSEIVPEEYKRLSDAIRQLNIYARNNKALCDRLAEYK